MKNSEYSSTIPTSDPYSQVNEALNKTTVVAHGAVDKTANAVDVAARKATPAINRTADMAHRAVDSAAAAVTPAAEWLNDQALALNDAQKKLVSDARRLVAGNPLISVGMALAAGFLISRMLRK